MAILSQSEIYTLAVIMGMPQPKVMAAIAMAESSGDTDVVNSIGATGLWQINQPVHVKAHPTWTKSWLQNPVNNAIAAKSLLKSQGLTAWEAYTNGNYAQYLSVPVKQDPKIQAGATQAGYTPGAQQAGFWVDPFKNFWDDLLGKPKRGPGSEQWDEDTQNLPDLTVDPGLGDIAEGVYGFAEAIQKAGAWMSKSENWVRVGYVAGGSILTIAALLSIARPVISNVAPQAKMLGKLVKKG